MSILTGTIQYRQGTSAEWTAANPTLLQAEVGFETDTRRKKTGDGATAWNDLGYDAESASVGTELLTGGAITVGVFGANNVRVAAATWYITGFGTFSTAGNSDFSCAVAAAGLVRYDGFYGKTDGTITKVTGAEAATAAFPATPADHALIGYVLVTDAAVSTTPDLSGYVLKADKASPAEVLAGTEDAKYITPYGLAQSGAAGGAGNQSAVIKSNIPISHTGTTSQTKIWSELIPAGTFEANDIFHFIIRFAGTGSNTKTIRIFIHTLDQISGATQLALYSHGSAAALFDRRIWFQNSLTSQRTIVNSTNTPSETTLGATTGEYYAPSVDFTVDQYLMVAVTLNSGTDTETIQYIVGSITR